MSGVDWDDLREAFGQVACSGADSGEVCILLGARKQCVQVRVESSEGSTLVVRLSSDTMTHRRALQTLMIPSRQAAILLTEEDEEEGYEPDESPAESSPSAGRKLLDLMGHNHRLRGVHLHLDADRLRASSDLVCLSGEVDMALLKARIERLARIADGMELRATGSEDRY
jgi:hypothetical protein